MSTIIALRITEAIGLALFILGGFLIAIAWINHKWWRRERRGRREGRS